MKKKMLVMAGIVALVAVAGAEIINWTGAFPLSTVPASPNGAVSAGWHVQMYASDVALTGTWYNDITINTDGTIAAGSGVMQMSTVLGATLIPASMPTVTVPGPVSAGAPRYLYSVLFDGVDIASADNFKVLDKVAYAVPASSGLAGTPVASYVISLQSGGTPADTAWTAMIPEPATIGLMGIAGLGMFLARRKANR